MEMVQSPEKALSLAGLEAVKDFLSCIACGAAPEGRRAAKDVTREIVQAKHEKQKAEESNSESADAESLDNSREWGTVDLSKRHLKSFVVPKSSQSSTGDILMQTKKLLLSDNEVNY